jgi:integrase
MGRRLKCDLPYVKAYRDRHGKLRHYFRRKGSDADGLSLPGAPGSPEFLGAYQRALDTKPNARTEPTRSKPGTLDALRELYFGSAEFKNLRQSTQRETRYALDALCLAEHVKFGTRGAGPIVKLERRHILKWRDEMADRPGAANKMIRVVKLLLNFAVDRGLRTDNPARGIRLLKGGRYRAWTDTELVAFERRWGLGTVERTGYALALYTGQRREDLTKMAWSDIAGDAILVTQGKTGRRLKLPLHPELKKALMAVTERDGAAIMCVPKGTKKARTYTAMSPVYFGHKMADAIASAGLPDDCVLHGLRKTTARILRELGVEASSMTGHLSAQMEREYARDADQAKMARDAVAKWSKTRR